MKTEHLTLPALQVAAALFFASSVQAADQADTYCVDINDVIVDNANCDGTASAATFFVIDGAPGSAVGSKVEGAIGTKIDSTDKTALANGGFTTGGFGRRQEQPPPDDASGVLANLGSGS